MLPILPLTQALQMRHGVRHPGLRSANTLHAIREIAAAGLLPAEDCATLAEQYRFLRRVSLGLRLFGTRPADTLELAGPNPARLAKTSSIRRGRTSSRTTGAAPRGCGPSTIASCRSEAPRQAPGSRVMRARLSSRK
jgi:hypothetical protein